MEGQPVIDVRVPMEEGLLASAGALLVDDAPPKVVLELVPPPVVSATAAALRLFAWRAVLAVAVVLALVGMLAWSSQPPA